MINLPVSANTGSLKVGLKFEVIGGMAPWREIWSTVEDKGGQPLLGVPQWRNRVLRRGPPKRGEQEWIRYRAS